jgi:DeoR family transcriptional regulator of aga operon/DeoR family fructose operon transcriptional repressor
MASDSTRLLPSERQQRIKQLVLTQGSLRVTELAEQFGVSEMTIRRDFELLEEAGHLERTFGGAVASEQTAFETSYTVRLSKHKTEKTAIASYAASLIQDGDSIALDASTTCLALARELSKRPLTIITNSLDCAIELRSSSAKVLLTGGYLRQVSGSFAGPLALKALQEFRVDHCFISAKGVSLEDGFMDSDPDEVEVKRTMLTAAAKKTALLDSSKFDKRALVRICGIAEVDLMVSDDYLSPDWQNKLKSAQVPHHLVEASA